MPKTDRHRDIFETFLAFFPAWKEHVETWDGIDADTVSVSFKQDGYTTSGQTYIFGDRGCDDWHLDMRRGEKHD